MTEGDLTRETWPATQPYSYENYNLHYQIVKILAWLKKLDALNSHRNKTCG